MTARGILSALLALLAGCARGRVDITQIPVTEQQRALAKASVTTLRDQFNQKDCLSIYRQASPAFQRQRENDWLNDCDGLRTALGPWQRFTMQATLRCGRPDKIVCADGLAAFEKATKTLEASWVLDHGQAKLMWLVIQDKGQSQVFGGSHRLLADPPPARPARPA
jgi:hypothetical protein